MKIKQAIFALLEQLLEMLYSISDRGYSQKLKIFNDTSIGQHTRHIYELIECLVVHKQNEVLCYDERNRDVELEVSRTLIISKIRNIEEELIRMNKEGNIKVKHYLGEMGDVILDSSIQRELLFVFDHTVHHLAIVRIGIENDFPHISLSSDFGFTPSTLRYLTTRNK